MRRLVLFDIDGTLLSSSSSGWHALRAAFAEYFEALEFYDLVRFDGKTDRQIIRELYQAAGVPHHATDAQVDIILNRYLHHLERRLADRHHLVRTLPGIIELVEALHRQDDVVVGLLTGNVVPGAELKLAAAGLDLSRFRLGAYGSDSAHRPDLPPIAAARAEKLFGRIPTGHEVVILGDTPADVTCGASIGARAIGVATGRYSVAELQAAGAYAAFEDFADTAAVLEAIL